MTSQDGLFLPFGHSCTKIGQATHCLTSPVCKEVLVVARKLCRVGMLDAASAPFPGPCVSYVCLYVGLMPVISMTDAQDKSTTSAQIRGMSVYSIAGVLPLPERGGARDVTSRANSSVSSLPG